MVRQPLPTTLGTGPHSTDPTPEEGEPSRNEHKEKSGGTRSGEGDEVSVSCGYAGPPTLLVPWLNMG